MGVVLMLIAVVAFGLAAFGRLIGLTVTKIDLIAVGLFVWALSTLL